MKGTAPRARVAALLAVLVGLLALVPSVVAFTVEVQLEVTPQAIQFVEGDNLTMNVILDGWTDCPNFAENHVDAWLAVSQSPSPYEAEPRQFTAPWTADADSATPRWTIHEEQQVWLNRTEWGRLHGFDAKNRWTFSVGGTCVAFAPHVQPMMQLQDAEFSIRGHPQLSEGILSSPAGFGLAPLGLLGALALRRLRPC